MEVYSERHMCKEMKKGREIACDPAQGVGGSEQPSTKGDPRSSFLSILPCIIHEEVAGIWLQMFV